MDGSWVCWIAAAARLRARRWQKSVIPIENDHCIRWILESRIFNAFPRFFDSQGEKKLQRLPVSFFEGLKVFCSSMFKVLKTASFLWLACCFTAISSSVLLCAVHTKTACPLHKKIQINDEMHSKRCFFSQLWCGHLNHHAQWLLEKKWPFRQVKLRWKWPMGFRKLDGVPLSFQPPCWAPILHHSMPGKVYEKKNIGPSSGGVLIGT